MNAAMRGHLISATFAASGLRGLPGAAAPSPAVAAALEAWSERRESALGPASSVRAITDAAVVPLLTLAGFQVLRRVDRPARVVLHAAASPSVVVPVAVVGWSEPLDGVWRDVVRDGIEADARWCLCCSGTALRIVDAHHTWSRRYLEFDLALLPRDEDARSLFWAVVRAEAMARRPPLVETAAELSARQGAEVCDALGRGVLDAVTALFGALAVRHARRGAHVLFDQSLTVLYRVLFLLFAEARGLVPVWHPVYRERYTIGAIVSALLARRPCRGLWHAVLAISRLAHAGCRAGELRVTAFNGRLFSPAYSSAFDQTRISDDVMRRAVMAVGTTAAAGGGLERIGYADLDVEQLGAVYERVLEYEPAPGGPAVMTRTRDTRQSTGTFYTPRSVTAFLVRQTLEPLVHGRGADGILQLRVLDPAMGSGAFLVGACRYLAAAAEQALIHDGRWHAGDVTAADRAALRREIAQRCLFGADINPMAVQLARLSLWLATLASDKPLTFLDHHLVAGDSLIGAGIDDVRRQPPGGPRRRNRPAPLPLLGERDVTPVLEQAVRARLRLAHERDDSAAIVADKERRLRALHAPHSPLGRWSRVLDLWCAGWFWDDGAPPSTGAFGELCDALLRGRTTLPDRAAASLLDRAAALAARHRFLHWPLAFPEVFCDERGDPLAAAGFDAVVGNPPWDMVRGDSGDPDRRAGRRADAQRVTAFVREAGVYRVDARSHVNRYQLFVERALQLTRAGGRIGLVVPAGLVADTGAAPLRRHLFDPADVDSVTGLDNRGGFFAVHRSLRFVLLTATTGRPTSRIACRFGVAREDDLETGDRPAIAITRQLLGRLSGDDDLGIPDMAGAGDLRIVEHISARVPWLGAAGGWNVRFGRELNATDDRRWFRLRSGQASARPVLEGKQIEPFRTAVERSQYELVEGAQTRGVPRRPRLAYRDIASATTRLTLIAAIVPARAVTTHTLFCLRTALPLDAQQVLCALLNSFVANYLIRMRVNTHVTVSLVSRLPVPIVDARHAAFGRLAQLSRALADGHEPAEAMTEYPELQALVARLYGLQEADVEHILGTFPLIPADVKGHTVRIFRGLH
ncbi:MAG: N-6 DNA methylase [Acidobacteria bacterium]|nr:N-6 DNA methylase [Acidobacteriota bacterium]